ncbi:hypothetical protein [Streptomyces sp. Ncost-T10-10d]|uniref:hypothetical protein n=1 Tax=Streptomyces sp. Ncost-T10-10d TaxID=1839774 RepID=UPI00081DF49F|nr:hypothetical protein GA0115254_11903 [Streptomyces sp. Ncost-T10-10d]
MKHRSDHIIKEPEAVREPFQELPPNGVGLGFSHRPEQVDQFAPLVARQLDDQAGDTLQDLDRVVRIHLLVFTALDEPQDIDQGLNQGVAGAR